MANDSHPRRYTSPTHCIQEADERYCPEELCQTASRKKTSNQNTSKHACGNHPTPIQSIDHSFIHSFIRLSRVQVSSSMSKKWKFGRTNATFTPMSAQKITRLDQAPDIISSKSQKSKVKIDMPMPTIRKEEAFMKARNEKLQPKINGQIAKIKNSTKARKDKKGIKKKHQHSIIVQCPRHNSQVVSLPFPSLSPSSHRICVFFFFRDGPKEREREGRETSETPSSSINSIMHSISQKNQNSPHPSMPMHSSHQSA